MTMPSPAISSLRAVEAWVGLIDAEMAGLGRTAFKAWPSPRSSSLPSWSLAT